MSSYYFGPLCESWFQLDIDEFESCQHDTCWAVMCIGDSMVSYWFKPEHAPQCDVRTMIVNELCQTEASAVSIREFIGRLSTYQTPDVEFAQLIPMAVANFEKMAAEYDGFAANLRKLARELGISAPGSGN